MSNAPTTPRRRPWYTATVLTTSLLTLAGLLLAGTVGRTAFAAPAVDAPATVTLTYTCPFPLIGNQDVPIRYTATVPSTVRAGDPLTVRDVGLVLTFPDTATQGFTLVGAKTIEGSLSTPLAVSGGTPATTTVQAEIPKTTVPASGPFDATSGTATPGSVTIAEPGTATVGVRNVRLTLTPRTANGAETGLGTFDSDCTPRAGQATTLAQVVVTPVLPPSTTAPTTTTTTTVPPSSTAPPTTTTTTAPPTTTTPRPDPVAVSVRGGGSLVVDGRRYSIAVDARSTVGGTATGRVAISGPDATAGSRTIGSVTRNGRTGQVAGTAVRSDGRTVPFRLTVVDRAGGGDQVMVDLGGRILAGTLTSGDIVVS